MVSYIIIALIFSTHMAKEKADYGARWIIDLEADFFLNHGQ
jgi:hypothetical protein